MKIRVINPMEAVATTGGCTFEVEVGWWTYINQPTKGLGKPFKGERDALYIPILQKNGQPIVQAEIDNFKGRALKLGFTELSPASGMWILSTTGEVQVEHIWICWTESVGEKVRAEMPKLAQEIKQVTNQDCVAWESSGQLHFTA